MQPGIYRYIFHCQLPAELPSSLEGDRGHIRYTARVNLDRPLWPDMTFESTFAVVKPLDLSLYPALRVSDINCATHIQAESNFDHASCKTLPFLSNHHH